ncbi:MAG: UDP-N-acetylmuramate dehydrogenase [Clostridia bacterium]|nr:UDP-N-acetylmuramate dehydrogenase [Clostridia bacterium]
MGKAEYISELNSRGVAFLTDEPMKKHTTFKIGGNADIFVSPENEDELIFAVSAARAKGLHFCIIGNGSDLLVSDGGVEGAVICLDKMRGISAEGDTVTVFAGQSMMSLCTYLQKAGLSGLEFAYGIPGTVGGAVYMNAGAYGGEINDVIVSARFLGKSGEIKEITKEEMRLSYRKSVFQENGGIIISAKLRLKKDDPEKILERMNDYYGRRVSKQPLDYPSAGSVFRRPEGNFAGALIEKSGLKGERVGGAQVSEKHAGFIINIGGATCEDVRKLIERIREKVLSDSGVTLDTEVIFIGR